MRVNNIGKIAIIFILLLFRGYSGFGQCPTLSKANVTFSNVNCFGESNGSIKIELDSTGVLSTNKFYFVLYKWNYPLLER
ncbi:MAG TPA: hypothetical protein DCR46_07145, partial [Cytophagales bacterium]|nr:hypothetical protein [Cytophagales bacterium]